MSVKVNVRLSRNAGLREAGISAELAIDGAVAGDGEKVRDRLRQLFSLLRAALAEELNGHPNGSAEPNSGSVATIGRSADAGDHGHGRRDNGARPVPPSQVKALHAIARSRGVTLANFLRERFGVGRLDDLTLQEASRAIDALKTLDVGQAG